VAHIGVRLVDVAVHEIHSIELPDGEVAICIDVPRDRNGRCIGHAVQIDVKVCAVIGADDVISRAGRERRRSLDQPESVGALREEAPDVTDVADVD
jgi:hypothetical protein